MRFALWILVVALSFTSFAAAADPQWIWSIATAAQDGQAGECLFRKTIQIPEPQKGELLISCDNEFEVFLNGRRIGSGNLWQKRYRADVTSLLVPGRNIIAVRGVNASDKDPAGLAVQLTVTPKAKGEAIVIGTDKTWKFARKASGNWHSPDFDDNTWSDAFELGPYGKTAPWGAVGTIADFESAAPIATGKPNREAGLFQFREGDRVTLLGGTFIERMGNFGYFETALTESFPTTNLTFRNLGWSGDTVWGDARAVFGGRNEGFKRLISDVVLTKPTLLVLCYGENEAYEGETGVAEFVRGYEVLLKSLESTGARLVLIAPRQHENLGSPLPDQTKYNASLKFYRDATRELAARTGAAFIDLSEVLFVAEPKTPAAQLTDNAVHLSGYGEWKVAGELVRRFGGRPPVWSVDVNTKDSGINVLGTAISEVKADAQSVSFVAADRTLPAPNLAAEYAVGSQVSTSQPQHLQIRGLAVGEYEVRIDSKKVATATADSLAKGVDFIVPEFVQQSEELRGKILKKNELFFHRYRPQNETYLFLFRKHEQGNNAVEIPQFDPLIVAQEQEIAKLRLPKSYRVEVVPVSK